MHSLESASQPVIRTKPAGFDSRSPVAAIPTPVTITVGSDHRLVRRPRSSRYEARHGPPRRHGEACGTEAGNHGGCRSFAYR